MKTKTNKKLDSTKLESTYMHISTIDLTAKEWFDKVNGNSYFSARMVINYQLPGETTVVLPFQYGYGNHYHSMAMRELLERKLIPEIKDKHYIPSLWSYCDDNHIILRTNKIERCLKRDVKDFGTE